LLLFLDCLVMSMRVHVDIPRRHCACALPPHDDLQILAGEVDEDYFQQHCAFARQLQHLAMAAMQEQQQQEQQDVETWDACSSAVLEQQQLRGLLEAWGNARLLLQGNLQQGAAPSDEQQEQLLAGISRHCGAGVDSQRYILSYGSAVHVLVCICVTCVWHSAK
jgi:hypothetical protein